MQTFPLLLFIICRQGVPDILYLFPAAAVSSYYFILKYSCDICNVICIHFFVKIGQIGHVPAMVAMTAADMRTVRLTGVKADGQA